MNLRHFCIILFFALSAQVNAQSYYFKHYQVEQGLSHNTVFCTLQDKQGFMWFGTKDGLNRFDGYTFKVFRHEAYNKKTISNNMVHVLGLARDGSLWIGNDSGLDKYDPLTETFIHIDTSAGVRCVQFDDHNNCWYIAGASLIKYNLKTKKKVDYRPQQHFDATSAAIVQGTVWVSSTNGMIEKLNEGGTNFTGYPLFAAADKVTSKYIEKIFYAGGNKIFIGSTAQGFKDFDINTHQYRNLLSNNDNKTAIYVRDFIRYANYKYWIATESGVYIYDAANGSFINLHKHFNDPYSISDNAVYSLCRDSEGGVWAGTYFGGINYYPKQYSTFNKYYPKPDEDRGMLKGNVVREIKKDIYGNIWIGTEDNGLNKLAPDRRTWTHYLPGDKTSITNTNIHGILPLGNELFIGTFERGLNVMNIKTGKVERVYLSGADSTNIKSNFIICFCQTRSGLVLIGTTNGLYRYNQKNQDFTLLDKLPPSDFIYSIIEDHNGKVWIGTLRDGIYSYTPDNNIITKLNYRYPVKNALNTNTVNGIFEDSSHILWFATEGLGLWRYDPVKDSYKFYDTRNGFPSNYIFRLEEDNNKNLWISTTRGLVCFNPASEAVKTYTKANGLLSDQFNYNSSFKDADGTMYFGCVRGMISFNPADFKDNNFTPPVYFTGFQVANSPTPVNEADVLLNQSIITTKKINLSYNESSFSIDFAALGFSSPEMTRYRYMMKGLDKYPTELTHNRKVYFTQLKPGNYTFTVRAAGDNGIWTKDTCLEIDIAPPFWKSAWAYVVYCLTALLIGYLLLRNYHHKIREKNKRLIDSLENDKEKQIYNAKIEFFTNVAHEIRTPLTLIKGPMEKVIKKAKELPDVQVNLMLMEKSTNRLLELTNQLLDFRKTETNGFKLSFVKTNITELLAETFLLFRPMAEQKNLSYVFKHPAETLYAYVDIDTFNKIISNLVNNAIKYSQAVVEIELMEQIPDDTAFTIEVRNDGNLVPYEMREKIFEPFYRLKEAEKQTGTGIGLALSRSLAELHKGVLMLNKSINDLNIFNLTLPVHQEKEFDLHITFDRYDEMNPTNAKDIDLMKPVILLVDDNPDILTFIENDLIDKYTVLKALNSREALDVIGVENIQIIISDVMMPGIDGFELCKIIKTNFEYSHIPIILLTAKNTLRSKIEGLEVGADAYIEKPFSPEHLQVQIANLLINRTKIREHFASSPLASMKSMAYTKPDETFLDKLNTVIFNNIQDTALDVEQIANQMNMSKPTLYRKIKALSNLTINELINITRLKAAAKLLEEGEYKVYEVANMVGYSSQSHLARNFLKQFGVTPTDYQQAKRNKQKQF